MKLGILNSKGGKGGQAVTEVQLVPLELEDSTSPDPEEAMFDLHAIWAAVLRNRLPMAIIFGIALLAGVLSILLAKPVYRASASVQIDQQLAKVLGTEDSSQYQIAGDADRFLQTQVDILQSRDLAERVTDQLRLYDNKAFLESEKIKKEGDAAADKKELRDKVIDAVQKALSVNLPRMSRIAIISISNSDPIIAARIANAYADAFINGNLQRKFDQSTYSRKFLQAQLSQTRIKLENSEQALVNFARQAGLIELSSGSQDTGSTSSLPSLVTSDLVGLNNALTEAKAERIAAEQKWEQAQLTPLMSLPDVLANPAIQAMTEQLTQARVDYRELRKRLKDGHPTVQQKAAVVAALEAELDRQANRIRASIQDRYRVAARQEASLSASVQGLKGETLTERDRSIRYNILKREVDTNREMYNALLQRYKEVSAEAGVTTNNISVVDQAEPPKLPASPRPALNMALSLLLGLVGAGAWVYVREQLTDAVRTPDDVTKKAGLPLLGVTPMVPQGESPIKALEHPKSPFAEAIHAMRTSLELATAHGVPQTLSVTSTRPAEGKSTLSYSLARAFALAGKRVVLIDADMRAPSLHRIVGFRAQTGLSQVLAKQVALEDAILETAVDNLKLIQAGPLPPDPTLLLDGTRLSEILSALKAKYELILLDCPPVLGLADALQIGAKVEGTLVAIEANDIRFANLKTALQRLRNNRVYLLGAVLSKFNAARFGYGEYYGYYYSHYGEK